MWLLSRRRVFLKDKWYVQLEKDRNRMVWDIWPPVATLQPHLSWEYSGHASGTGAMLLAFDKLAICGYIHAYMCIYIYIFMYLFIYLFFFIYLFILYIVAIYSIYIYIYIYLHIHICIYYNLHIGNSNNTTCSHTHPHTCMHACIHTYIQTDRQTDALYMYFWFVHIYLYIYIYTCLLHPCWSIQVLDSAQVSRWSYHGRWTPTSFEGEGNGWKNTFCTAE